MSDEVYFEQLPKSEYPDWDRFVDSSVEKSPFSRLAWLEAFESASPRYGFSIAVSRAKSGEIAAGIAVLKRSKPFRTQDWVVPTLHPHNSLLISPSGSEEKSRIYARRAAFGTALIKFVRAQNFGSVRFIHHIHATDMRPFLWDDWRIIPAYTFLLDLRALQGATGFTPTSRVRYQKCQEAGFKMLVSDTVGSNLNVFLDLISRTYQRKGLNPKDYGLDAIPSYVQRLDREGALLYFEARTQKDQPASARILVPDADGTVYDWMAATHPDYLKSGATIFLIGEILNELKRHGFKVFDFGGANTPGIAEFKQSFNGTLVFGFETLLHSSKWKHQLIRTAGTIMHKVRTRMNASGYRNPE